MDNEVIVLGYYIEPDLYSWKVVREYVGNKGKSKGVVQKNVIGYYKSRESAYKNLKELLLKSELEGENISLSQMEYLNTIVEAVDKKLEEAIEREVND